MKSLEPLKNPEFVEHLEMCHKQYIDKKYTDAGLQPPIPVSLIPLSYADAKIQKGLEQLKQGSKNALYILDKFNQQQGK